jgi:hypothetical protein
VIVPMGLEMLFGMVRTVLEAVMGTVKIVSPT